MKTLYGQRFSLPLNHGFWPNPGEGKIAPSPQLIIKPVKIAVLMFSDIFNKQKLVENFLLGLRKFKKKVFGKFILIFFKSFF